MNAFVTGCAFVQDKVLCPVCKKLIPFQTIEDHLTQENKKSRSNELRMRQYGMNPDIQPPVMPAVQFRDDLEDDMSDRNRGKRKAAEITWVNWQPPAEYDPPQRGNNWSPATAAPFGAQQGGSAQAAKPAPSGRVN